jgi:hypothetical protein
VEQRVLAPGARRMVAGLLMPERSVPGLRSVGTLATRRWIASPEGAAQRPLLPVDR